MTFASEANSAQVTWKASTPLLPEEARVDGPYRGNGPSYPVCLPWEFAELNLISEARDVVLDRFARDGISWHGATDRGPTSHLRSSQIQCLNALGPFVQDPTGLEDVLRHAGISVSEILPWDESVADGDHVVFEWIGFDDYLGENPGGTRTRGANTTSADAAVRYRALDGAIEIALIEWKYTETYGGSPLPGGAASFQRRKATYERWWSAEGPLRLDLLNYEDLFVEPLYQLWRLQCLALEMERANELGAERVRLVVAAPRLNVAYWGAVPQHLATSYGDLAELWREQLREPDRFAVLDTSWLVRDESPLPESFKDRYRHLSVDTTSDPDELEPPDVDDIVLAMELSRAMALRVFGEGSVIESVLGEPTVLAHLGRDESAALVGQLREIAELTRRLRADQLAELVVE